MKLTKREKFMLFQALNYEIHRYLLSCTFGREDSCEKASRHINISNIILAFLNAKPYNIKDHEVSMEIHDYLAEILTDRMDEVIGFPLDRRPYDYDELVNKFFNVIIDHMDQIKNIVDNWYKENKDE